MTFMDKGVALTILILTVNAVLLVAMPMIDQDYAQNNVFSWIDPKIAEFGEDENRSISTGSYVDTNVTLSGDSIVADDTPSTVTAVPLLISWIPFIGAIWNLINVGLFGYMFAMQAAGVPSALIFIIGVPLSAIVLFTIFYLILRGISAITGGGG